MRASGHRAAREIAGVDELAAELANEVRAGDYIVCLGAGDITKWAAELADKIAGQRSRPVPSEVEGAA
jgi:UDP-N-acetylmuramate--alanine ligase